jgi:Ca2+-binding RTX toxin-like protein
MGRRNQNQDDPVVVLYGDASDETWIIGAYSYEIHGAGGDDTISDEFGNDVNDARDWYFGGEGNDKITSFAGSDRLYGNEGRDDFYFLAGNKNGFVKGGDQVDMLVVWDSDWHNIISHGDDNWTVKMGNGVEVTVEDVEIVKVLDIPPQYL